MIERWGRKWLEAGMCEVVKAKETLYSPFKSHLTFLDPFYVCVTVHRNLSSAFLGIGLDSLERIVCI